MAINIEIPYTYNDISSHKRLQTSYVGEPEPTGIISSFGKKQTLYIICKYVAEYMLAAVAFVILLPFMTLVALLIKLDSSGKIIFKQKRHGYLGKPFNIYKFRTMVKDAHSLQCKYSELNEMNGGKLFKSKHDPRITRLGRILRKYSIDELPQLVNILKGEMTVIGPRPISTPLTEYTPEQLVKFSVKPGLGAIWQAYSRGATDFNEWMKLDRQYVENISPGMDLKLLLQITKTVLTGEGSR
ncbi:MAG: sugar transferase [Balneolaceae bacterium]